MYLRNDKHQTSNLPTAEENRLLVTDQYCCSTALDAKEFLENVTQKKFPFSLNVGLVKVCI